MKIATRVFYKRLHLANADRIPEGSPVIFACNHPNSFLDGLSVTPYVKRPVSFLARSDIFNTKFKNWFLQTIHILPIYRLQEGKENLHKNDETQDVSLKVLESNEIVLIHAEGLCVVEKRLRKLKKGTARIAFKAEEAHDFKFDLHVVPVGFNYTYPTKFRKEVMIEFNHPIRMKDYESLYKENPSRAINAFNEKLTSLLEEVVLSIDNKESENLVEKLFIIFRNDYKQKFYPWKIKNSKRFEMEDSISKKINTLYESEKIKHDALEGEVDDYFSTLKSFKIADKSLSLTPTKLFFKSLFLLLAFPVFIFGYLTNVFPLRLTKFITDKMIKSDVFYSSTIYGLGYFLTLFYYIALVIVGGVIFKWIGLAAVAVIFISGFVALAYREVAKRVWNAMRFVFVNARNKQKIVDLKQTRLEIISKVDALSV